MFEDIPKELYKLRKSQSKKFKEAKDKGYNVYFSKKFPDKLYADHKQMTWNETNTSVHRGRSTQATCGQLSYGDENLTP